MRHILAAQQQPRYRTTDDSELALEAAKDLADLDEYRLKAIRKPPSRYTPTSPQQVIRTAIDIVTAPDGIDNGLAEAPS